MQRRRVITWGKSPSRVRKEIWAHMLAYNIIGFITINRKKNMFSSFFSCYSKSASEPHEPLIGERITEMNKTILSCSWGDAKSTAKLIEFSFETKIAGTEFPKHRSAYILGKYSHSQSVYTTNFTFVITLVFDRIGSAEGTYPQISDETSHRKVLIEHYTQETNTLIDQAIRKTTAQNIYVLDEPLEKYLKQYRHLDNVTDFLLLYERSNKVFTSNEAVPCNTVVVIDGSLSSMKLLGAGILQMPKQTAQVTNETREMQAWCRY